jgi:steroid delta-isomerase-like uncharacterized protein
MTATPTKETLRERIVALKEAYNAHDVDGLLACCTEDVIWTEPTLAAPLLGKEALRDHLRALFTAFPDLTVVPSQLRVYRELDGRAAVSTWLLTATMTGPMEPEGLAPTGRTAEIEGASMYELTDGLISRCQLIFDAYGFLHQLGLLPATTSPVLRLMRPVQHLGAALLRRR